MGFKARLRRWLELESPRADKPKPPADTTPSLVQGEEIAAEDVTIYARPPVVPYSIKRTDENIQAYTEHVQSYTSNSGTLATYRFQFDGDRSVQYDGRLQMPNDDPLVEWDDAMRMEVLTNCHAVFHRNPIAKAVIDLMRRFVIGKGHTVTALNQDVQAVIDRFRANPENAIQDHDRTFAQDIQVDGELFVRLFSEGGETIITQVPPWYIKDVNTAPGFMRRIQTWALEYVQNNEQIAENVPAADMIHVAINRHGYELRGRPDLFVILPWLRAYNEWLQDRARQNKWRSSLLWLVKVQATSAGMLNKVRSVFRKPPTPGSVAVVPDSVDVEALSNPIGANDASEDGRQIKLMSAIGTGTPEYMLSDGENANLASATAQQLPALWKFTDGQELLAEQVWTPIYRRVIQAAIDADELSDTVPVQDSEGNAIEGRDPVPTLEAFEVAYYELQADDPKTLAEAIATLTDRKIMSVETGQERAGLDPAQEQRRLDQQREQERDRDVMGTDTDLSGQPQNTDDDEEAGNDGE